MFYFFAKMDPLLLCGTILSTHLPQTVIQKYETSLHILWKIIFQAKYLSFLQLFM